MLNSVYFKMAKNATFCWVPLHLTRNSHPNFSDVMQRDRQTEEEDEMEVERAHLLPKIQDSQARWELAGVSAVR
jgi:hypothetical protein